MLFSFCLLLSISLLQKCAFLKQNQRYRDSSLSFALSNSLHVENEMCLCCDNQLYWMYLNNVLIRRVPFKSNYIKVLWSFSVFIGKYTVISVKDEGKKILPKITLKLLQGNYVYTQEKRSKASPHSLTVARSWFYRV